MNRSVLAAMAMAAVGLWASPATATTVLFNNLSNAPGSVLGTFPVGGGGLEGDSFSTGAVPFVLTDVRLALQGVADSKSFTVSLFSDNHTVCAPGPVCSGGPLTSLYTIATVSDNALSTSLADYDFSLTSPQTLAANATYWIIASSTDDSGTLWSYTQDLSGVGVAGEFNVTSGGVGPNSGDRTSNPSCFFGSAPEDNFCTPFQMEVSGTPVPEPGSLLLLGTGLLMTVRRLRRRPVTH